MHDQEPAHDKVALTEEERSKFGETSKEESGDPETASRRIVLKQDRDNLGKPVKRVEQANNLLIFLRACKYDLPKNTPKKMLEKIKEMLDVAKELAEDTPESLDKGKLTTLRRYILQQRNIFGVEYEAVFENYLALIPDIYPIEYLDPKKAAQQLQRKDASPDQIKAFLQGAKEDLAEIQQTQQWSDFRTAVEVAQEFQEEQKGTERDNDKKMMIMTVKDGKVEKKPRFTSQEEPDPGKGIYILSSEVPDDDPLSLKTASTTVSDAFRNMSEMLETANSALEKIQKGEELTEEEKVALVRSVERYQKYYFARTQDDERSPELKTLEKMMTFVKGATGGDEKNKAISALDKKFDEEVKAGKTPLAENVLEDATLVAA